MRSRWVRSAQPTHKHGSSSASSQVSHSSALLLDPHVTWTRPRRCLVHARVARAAGCAGDGLPDAHDGDLRPRLGNGAGRGARPPWNSPYRRVQAELRTGGAAEVIDLGLNGVRVTLSPRRPAAPSGRPTRGMRRFSSNWPSRSSSGSGRRCCSVPSSWMNVPSR